MIVYMKRITRQIVKNNHDKIFLFGDNLQRKGYGGQAKAMRGEPNAVGIPTKKKPTMDESSFFTDKEITNNVREIDNALLKIWQIKPDFDFEYDTIVIPSDGIGTGLAELPQRAPETYKHLLKRLLELSDNKLPDLIE